MTTLDTEIKRTSSTKRSSRKKGEKYWTAKHEEYVRQYLQMPEGLEADDFFRENLYPVLKKLIENIMFRYKLNISDANPSDQIKDVLSYVMSKFRKFEPDKGHKAFSYYGTVAKNYMILKKKKNYEQMITVYDIDELEGVEEEYNLYSEPEYESQQDSKEFFIYYIAKRLKEIIETDLSISPNTYKLAEVIIYLMDNHQLVNIYSKNQFYFLAKEMTSMSTKEITKALVELRKIYEEIKVK